MKSTKYVGSALLVAVLLASLPGCEKEGSAERAGKALDNTADKVGQQIEKAGEKIQDTAKGEKK